MTRNLRILMVENSESDAALMVHELKRSGFTVVADRVETQEAYVAALESGSWDIILCDYRMPKFSGFSALALYKQWNVDVPFIFVSGTMGEDLAVEAMKAGAHDYVLKENLRRLVPAIERELREADSRRESKRAVFLLNESESTFATLAEESPNMIFINKRGQVVFANRKCEEVMGYTKEEFYSPTFDFLTLIVPEQVGSVKEVFHRHSKSEEVPPYEYSLVTKQGKRLEAILTTKLIKFHGERAILGIVTDVTDRKQSEFRLRHALEWQEAIFEGSRDAIFISDADSRFVAVNEAACELTGYAKQELLSMRIPELHDRLDLEAYETFHNKILGGEKILTEAKILRKDGTKVDAEFNNTRVTIAGTVHMHTTARDVDVRKRAEEALHLQVSALESTANSIIITDADGTIQWANSAFSKMTGYTVDEIIGKNPRILKSGRQNQVYYAELWKTVVAGEVWHGVIINKRKDGTEYDEEMTITPVISGDGRIRNFVAVKQDVTQRKKAEEVLKRYELLSENARDVIFLIRREDGRIIEANKAAQSTYGYGREELLSLRVHDLRAPATLVDLPGQMEQADKEGIFIQTMHRRKDGTLFPVEVSSTGMVMSQARVLISIVRDITERKRAEDALREKDYWILESQRAAKIGSYVTDFTAGYWKSSEVLDDIFGIDQKYVRSVAGWLNLVHPDDQHELDQYLKGIIATKKPFSREYRILRDKDKQERWVLGRGNLKFDDRGNLLTMIGTIQDITEQKKAEERQKNLEIQLAQAQKMESLGTLAGGIAHDFNNILGIILGHVSLIGHSKNDPVVISNSLDTVTKAVRRGASLVRQILTFARKTQIAREPVDVNALIEELLKMLQETFPKTIEIATDLDVSLPVLAMDQTQLQQAIMNLCINGRDAMLEEVGTQLPKGRLTIRTSRVSGLKIREKFIDADASEYVCLEISDTGAGMTKVTKDKIFEPFFTTKGVGKGTGLGLAVVYGVVKGHQGYIDVQSEVGKGTTFLLYFPSSADHVYVAETQKPEEKDRLIGTETILVVEDEESLLNLMTTLLVRNGYTVIPARDGVEAVSEFERHRKEIALVLTDMGLPKLDGAEVFTMLKLRDNNVKVILASGYLEPQYRSELLKSGAKEFIQKPYIPEQVLRKIRNVLDGK